MAELQVIESEYKQLTDIEHVLLRAETYTGPRLAADYQKYLLHADGKIYPETVHISPATLLFANELICNSYDEAVRTRQPNSDRPWQITKIDVVVDLQRKSLTVRDDGGIKVAIDAETQLPIPVMIFGHLRTGSNYTDERGNLGGQNGLGSKVANIFSHSFHCYTADGQHSLQQTWHNNMREAMPTNIADCKDHFTELIAEFDLDEDKTKIFANYYGLTWARCIEARCIEVAASAAGWDNPLTVLFKCINEDGTEWSNVFCFKRYEDYLQMWPNADTMIVDKQYRFNIAVCESAGAQESSAIVNALQCPWGTHIETFVEACVFHIRSFIQNRYHVDIQPKKIRSHIKTISCWDIDAPTFAGQTKELLVSGPSTFGMPVIPSEQFIKKLLRSKLVQSIVDEMHQQIYAAQRAAIEQQQKQMDRRVKKNLMPDKLTDAALAGREPEKCMMFIVEGLSAAGGLKKFRHAETQGTFAMFGKSCGCMLNRDEAAVLNNKALAAIMQSLGLSFVSKNRLRYDKVVIATDADEDGSCIAGLLLVFFNKFFPELIEQGHLYRLVTPLMTAFNTKTKELRQYFSLQEFNDHRREVSGREWQIGYNKGLASLSDEAYQIIMENPRLDQIEKDDLADSSIAIWFGNDSSYRKEAMSMAELIDDSFFEELANGEQFDNEEEEDAL